MRQGRAVPVFAAVGHPARRGNSALRALALCGCVLSAPAGAEPRNAILFIGDGMGVSTVTAARIFAGQQRGEPGEENYLSFERFPNVALVKTYNTDQQVPDSAGTMSAIVTGLKTRAGVLSVGPSLARGDCENTAAESVPTLLEEAEAAGLATGIVTTTRFTHATPAAAYAHAPDRNWEADAMVPEAHREHCKDIALQFVEFAHGDGVDVALGGGRGMFLPRGTADPEAADEGGARTDGRHLVGEWLAARPGRQYVWNDEQFRAVAPDGQLLGLFEHSHMRFEVDRGQDVAGEPSLAAMTQAAIARLATAPRGYFLIVEGGRIDHAHHATNAYRALEDTLAFADAVQVAIEMTDAADTLLLVTADHSHTLTISGYSKRGNAILGFAEGQDAVQRDMLGRRYTTLSYANGPGFREEGLLGSLWSGVTNAIGAGDGSAATIDEPLARDYRQAATWPLLSETHSGEDVAAYARGPNADEVRGVMDQNELHGVLRGALFGLGASLGADAADAGADDAIVPPAAAKHGN